MTVRAVQKRSIQYRDVATPIRPLRGACAMLADFHHQALRKPFLTIKFDLTAALPSLETMALGLLQQLPYIVIGVLIFGFFSSRPGSYDW